MNDTVRARMEAQVKRLNVLVKADRERIRTYLHGQQIGQERPTDEQVLEFVAAQQRKYPPVQIVTPEGRVMFASPWFVLLGELKDDHADDLVERFVRAATMRGGM